MVNLWFDNIWLACSSKSTWNSWIWNVFLPYPSAYICSRFRAWNLVKYWVLSEKCIHPFSKIYWGCHYYCFNFIAYFFLQCIFFFAVLMRVLFSSQLYVSNSAFLNVLEFFTSTRESDFKIEFDLPLVWFEIITFLVSYK